MNEQQPNNEGSGSGDAQKPSPPESTPITLDDLYDRLSTLYRQDQAILARQEMIRESIFWLGILIIAGVFYLETK